MSGRVSGRAVSQVGTWEKVCLGCISETIRCRKLILDSDIAMGHWCATSWHDLDLTFDLAIVTLSLKILFELYPGNHKLWKVDTWQGHWLGVVGVQCHFVTLI